MSSTMIDRDSPIPVYYQIQMDLKKRIMRREWGTGGGRFPPRTSSPSSTMSAASRSGRRWRSWRRTASSRNTRGKGTYIEADPTPFIHNLSYSLVTSSDRSAQQHYAITADMLQQKLVSDLFPDVCEHLQLRPNQSAVYIKRLFLLNNRPIAIGRSYLPSDIVPGLEASPFIFNSLSQTLLNRYQLKASLVEDSLEAVRSTQSECTLLKCHLRYPAHIGKGHILSAGWAAAGIFEHALDGRRPYASA